MHVLGCAAGLLRRAEVGARAPTAGCLLLLFCAAAEERQEGLKLVVAVCKAVSKSDVATAEGLVAGWDLVQDRPELAKAAATKLVDEIESRVKKMTKAVGRTATVAPTLAPAAAVAPYGSFGFMGPMVGPTVQWGFPGAAAAVGGASSAFASVPGRRPPGPCYMCSSSEHQVVDCSLNPLKWPYKEIQQLIRKGQSAAQIAEQQKAIIAGQRQGGAAPGMLTWPASQR